MKKIIIVFSVFVMLIAIDSYASNCPCRIVLNDRNMVIMVDKNNRLIKRYSNTMNRSNCEVYSDGNQFWVRKTNNWVTVYNVKTGFRIKTYSVPRGSKQSWIR